MTRITGVSKAGGAAPSKKLKATGGAFSPAQAPAPNAPASTGETAPVATLSALIALQSEDYGSGKGRNAKTFAAAQHILDELGRLQTALLNGVAAPSSLEALEAAASLRAHAGADAELLGIYDEIALRARVELAKLGR